jgi:pyruvate/2-oxoglutarate dehydrogenase complex dihydrolipoamide acyltransferase (E2) component
VAGNLIGFSVGYDHRFIDGRAGQEFTTRLKNEIETIERAKVL